MKISSRPIELRCLADFRRWATSEDFPAIGRIDYVEGQIKVDLSPQDLHTHGKLRTELIGVVGRRIKQAGLGELYTSRARVSCPEADLSAEPDVVFVSESSLDSSRVRLVPKTGGAADRYVELEGPPDLIVEIVSDASVRKDTERLPAAYYRAGGHRVLTDRRPRRRPALPHPPPRPDPIRTGRERRRRLPALNDPRQPLPPRPQPEREREDCVRPPRERACITQPPPGLVERLSLKRRCHRLTGGTTLGRLHGERHVEET